MSIREKLLGIRGPVSPKRINEVIHPTERDTNTMFNLLPDEVKARLDRGSGKLDRKRRFLKNLEILLEGDFTFAHILQMDEKCVDNKGRINEERLKAIINGEYDD